ncbi:MAG: UDP-2,3-diacylglucosamine diphosphatase [Patescibacteria group bacterium]|nr:UDP-2,3-diacylglucosamine diphosphatase [Patescibacteria group bacterium]
MRRKHTQTMIVSDIHLGSRVSRSNELLKLLKSYSFKKLILLGDIFEHLNFRNLTNEHWELLSYFKELSRDVEIIWIEGNHDVGLSKVMSNLVGLEVFKTYIWRYKGKKCLAIHGHQFDRFLSNNIILSYLATIFYALIQEIDTDDQRMARFVKRKSKGWLRLSRKVANSAVLYGKLRGAKYVFCGHTHQSAQIEKRGVKYFNSGCWTDIPSSYITMNKKGIKIHEVF